MTVEDTPKGFRYEFVVLILLLIVAMTQPAIQRSALSIFSTNDAAAVCAGRRCQASNDQNVLLLHELTAGAPATQQPCTQMGLGSL